MPAPLRNLLALAAFAAAAASALAQTTPESGTFLLHKFAQQIGKETYTITPGANGLDLKSDFLFTDRGTKVPLTTSFHATPDLTPISLTLEGRYSRESPAHDTFEIKAGELHRTHDGKNSTQPVPAHFFLIDGYSPVAMQQMLLRFWLTHGKPASLSIPTGSIHIEPAGPLKITSHGQQLQLTGYTVSGLIWGVESLWLDDHQNLAALVSTDAEFDHFEAVRDSYEDSLPAFISAAAHDDLAALARITTKAKLTPAKSLAITGATLIDGNGGPPIPNAIVLLSGDTITAAGPASSIPIPKDAAILDAKGKYLIPGLWDMHAHYEQVEWGPIYLAAGVTTVRDCGNEFDFITTVRDAVRNGTGIGPEILIAGIVDGPGPMAIGAITAGTPEQAIAVVHRYHDAGAVQIKIYSSMSPALVPVITAEAHKLGMTVTGHVPNGMTTVQAVEAGMDQINHIQYPMRDAVLASSPDKAHPALDFTNPAVIAQIAVYRQYHTVFDPTVSLFEWMAHSDQQPISSFEPGITHVAPQLTAALDTTGIPAEKAPMMQGRYKFMLDTIRELHKDGLDIVAGTDQNIPGYSLHRELEIYVQAGFTPMQALQAATTVPARVLGMSKTVGSIEPGKRADLVILDADPLANIANTRRIAKTIAAGAVYDPAPLWQSVDFKP